MPPRAYAPINTNGWRRESTVVKLRVAEGAIFFCPYLVIDAFPEAETIVVEKLRVAAFQRWQSRVYSSRYGPIEAALSICDGQYLYAANVLGSHPGLVSYTNRQPSVRDEIRMPTSIDHAGTRPASFEKLQVAPAIDAALAFVPAIAVEIRYRLTKTEVELLRIRSGFRASFCRQ